MGRKSLDSREDISVEVGGDGDVEGPKESGNENDAKEKVSSSCPISSSSLSQRDLD